MNSSLRKIICVRNAYANYFAYATLMNSSPGLFGGQFSGSINSGTLNAAKRQCGEWRAWRCVLLAHEVLV